MYCRKAVVLAVVVVVITLATLIIAFWRLPSWRYSSTHVGFLFNPQVVNEELRQKTKESSQKLDLLLRERGYEKVARPESHPPSAEEMTWYRRVSRPYYLFVQHLSPQDETPGFGAFVVCDVRVWLGKKKGLRTEMQREASAIREWWDRNKGD